MKGNNKNTVRRRNSLGIIRIGRLNLGLASLVDSHRQRRAMQGGAGF
jgi:hypothetical protein